MPRAVLSPTPGAWLLTCRAGFETFLFEELAWQGVRPRLLGPALVESEKAPKEAPAFARAGFPVAELVEGADLLRARVEKLRSERLGAQAASLNLWAPDTNEGNQGASSRQQLAQALGESESAESAQPGAQGFSTNWNTFERGGSLLEVCEFAPGQFALGTVRAREALSLWPGGKRRMRRGAVAPSRAAMKLDEALDSVPLPPGRGDVCVDLGAAPGGWTARLVERGARVIAVDPAKLTPELTRHPKVRHVQDSAFAFEPDEPVDWLFCDMAWRPLEVAQLLAKWARRQWALQLCANIKLPMNDKLPIVHRVRHTVLSGGWSDLKIRQLYHDRDEVTVIARR